MGKENDVLGDRMKEFESAGIGQKAMRGLPLLARLDGRAFHTFTKGLKRPYDERLSECMIETAKFLVKETHAKVGYTQSDEISLAWFIDEDSTSEFMFDGKAQKLVSVLAGMASAKFSRLIAEKIPEKAEAIPVFDCRVWQVPNRNVAAEAFLWRELDASKNSVSMAAHAYFSHKSLHGKTSKEKQEMLFQEHGINWNDYPAFFKRGVYIQRKEVLKPLEPHVIEKLRKIKKGDMEIPAEVMRTEVQVLDLPPARKITNYCDVLFHGVEPESFDF